MSNEFDIIFFIENFHIYSSFSYSTKLFLKKFLNDWQMWPKLIAKAKEGGIDVIQTYVFWNVHEPVQGQVGPLYISIQMPNRTSIYMRSKY